jgi:hypothetical protein
MVCNLIRLQIFIQEKFFFAILKINFKNFYSGPGEKFEKFLQFRLIKYKSNDQF